MNTLKECDVIMKGGVTSGVIYPKAILKLSERYRFRSIGGTSAGAIAAAAASRRSPDCLQSCGRNWRHCSSRRLAYVHFSMLQKLLSLRSVGSRRSDGS